MVIKRGDRNVKTTFGCVHKLRWLDRMCRGNPDRIRHVSAHTHDEKRYLQILWRREPPLRFFLHSTTLHDRGSKTSGGPLREIIDRVRRGNCFSAGFGDEYSRDSDTTVVPRRCSKAEWFSSCRWTEEPSGWLVLRDESMGRYAMRRSRWTECCTSSAPKSHRRVFGRAFGPLNLNIASCQVT